jgi:hypothetical protein
MVDDNLEGGSHDLIEINPRMFLEELRKAERDFRIVIVPVEI